MRAERAVRHSRPAEDGENGWLGSKSGQGFYKKDKGKDGKSEILQLDLKTLEYVPQTKPKFDTLAKAKDVDDVRARMAVLYGGTDKAGRVLPQELPRALRLREPPRARRSAMSCTGSMTPCAPASAGSWALRALGRRGTFRRPWPA